MATVSHVGVTWDHVMGDGWKGHTTKGVHVVEKAWGRGIDYFWQEGRCNLCWDGAMATVSHVVEGVSHSWSACSCKGLGWITYQEAGVTCAWMGQGKNRFLSCPFCGRAEQWSGALHLCVPWVHVVVFIDISAGPPCPVCGREREASS